jgi:MFS family permease
MRAAPDLSLLRDGGYRNLFVGQTISFLGDGMAPVAIAFLVLDLTGSATDLGIVLASRSVAILVFIVAGGVLADRMSPRRAMLRADVIRFLVVGLMSALVLLGTADVWEIAVLYGLEGMGAGLFSPASKAIIPVVVEDAQLQPANSLLSLTRSAGWVAGPALAGVLLAVGEPGSVLAIDAASFAISALFLWRLRERRRVEVEASSFVGDLREGWSEFSSRPWLWACVLAATFGNAVFFPAFQVLGPTIARDSLGGSSAWALIAAAFGFGLVLGGFVALSIRPRHPLLVSQAAIFLLALPLALLAVPATAALIALGALVAGAAISVGGVLFDTNLQQHIPLATLSRVSSYDWAGSLALEPIGLLVIAPIAAGVGLSPTLWGAALFVLLCQAAVVGVPRVRSLPARPAAEGTRPFQSFSERVENAEL